MSLESPEGQARMIRPGRLEHEQANKDGGVLFICMEEFSLFALKQLWLEHLSLIVLPCLCPPPH